MKWLLTRPSKVVFGLLILFFALGFVHQWRGPQEADKVHRQVWVAVPESEIHPYFVLHYLRQTGDELMMIEFQSVEELVTASGDLRYPIDFLLTGQEELKRFLSLLPMGPTPMRVGRWRLPSGTLKSSSFFLPFFYKLSDEKIEVQSLGWVELNPGSQSNLGARARFSDYVTSAMGHRELTTALRPRGGFSSTPSRFEQFGFR